MAESTTPIGASQYRLGFGTRATVIPDGWFQSNSHRPTITPYRLFRFLVPVAVVVLFAYPNITKFDSWLSFLAGCCVIATAERVYDLVRFALQKAKFRRGLGRSCYVFFGVPSRIFTPERSIFAEATFGGGVTINGKGIDYSIAQHRITNCSLGAFQCFGTLSPGMRIDWLTDTGEENSLYLAFSENTPRFDLEKNAADLTRGNWVAEKLPPDVSWLPNAEIFNPSKSQWYAMASITVLSVALAEVLRLTLVPNQDRTLWILLSALFSFALMFGILTQRHERDVLRNSKAKR